MTAASFATFAQGQDAVGGSLESLATTVSNTEFTPGPVGDLLTHQRLFSAQLQVCTASTHSYGKIQYFKINFFLLLLLIFNGIHIFTLWTKLFCSLLASQAASSRNANLHKGETVKNISVCLQFHTCYYYFMYNYIWVVQIKGWLHLSIMGIKKMPATCCNVMTSCATDTPLWRMWVHGRVQNISSKTPFRPAVPLFPMEIMLSDALIISDQGTWSATQFCCGGGKCDTKKYCEIKISVNKPS